MKKLIFLFLFGGFSIYGFSSPPIDPPKKTNDNNKTVAPSIAVCTDNTPEISRSSPNPNEECTESRSVVNVTVTITLNDCPDYDCSLPGPTCTCEICIYNVYDCSGTPLGCSETWDPEVCTYRIPVQANETDYLYASFSCHNCSYGNGCQVSDNPVPIGGGDVTISYLEACPY